MLITILLAVLGLVARGDDTQRLTDLLAGGGTVTIPPGDYHLAGLTAIPLVSHTSVSAHGARFIMPDTLDDGARLVLFSGSDLEDFTWHGGHFVGHVFDPATPTSSWPPSANTRAILVSTTPGGRTTNLAFRELSAEGVAGAVITVQGAVTPGSDRAVTTFARNVSVENCTFQRSGKFMWDYGYLWQITVWPEDFGEAERAVAARYFRQDLVRGPVRMAAGDDRVSFANGPRLPLTGQGENGHGTICFFGDVLPTNLVRGRQYFVVESTPEFVRIADRPGGPPLRFATAAGPGARLISDLFQAHLALYAPSGSGPGKGAIDLVACDHVVVRGCRLGALGDTMHIQRSQAIVFTGNQITASRMGAFFLAEFCRDAVISGNTVDGTNGSRVMSVEKSCADVAIVGNTFRNGGRGSWINQPRNFLLADNVFVNNTTKCEPNPRRGRRSFETGDYERYAEVYFTTHEPGGRYGNVTIRGNIFVSGPHASHAITFAPGGDVILVSDNIFRGPVRDVVPADGCTNVEIRGNLAVE
jgi:hypothetical protein